MCKRILSKLTDVLLLQVTGYRPLPRPAAVADRLVRDPARLDPGQGQVSAQIAELLRSPLTVIRILPTARSQALKVSVAQCRTGPWKQLCSRSFLRVTKLREGTQLRPLRASLGRIVMRSRKTES